LTVFGEFEPQNVVGHRVDPKRHFLTSQRVFRAIVREFHAPVTSVGESGENKNENENKNKKGGLIFHVFRQALPYDRLAQILGYVYVSWT